MGIEGISKGCAGLAPMGSSPPIGPVSYWNLSSRLSRARGLFPLVLTGVTIRRRASSRGVEELKLLRRLCGSTSCNWGVLASLVNECFFEARGDFWKLELTSSGTLSALFSPRRRLPPFLLTGDRDREASAAVRISSRRDLIDTDRSRALSGDSASIEMLVLLL